MLFNKLKGAGGAGGEPSYWISLLGLGGNEDGFGVTVDSGDNVIITGRTFSQGQGSGDILTAKFNPKGSLLWQRLHGGNQVDRGLAVSCDSSDNIYVAGTNESGVNDFTLLKYSPSGVRQVHKSYGGSLDDVLEAVEVNSEGDLIISGGMRSTLGGYTNAGGYDFLVSKIDGTTHNPIWSRAVGTSNFTEFYYDIALDASDNIYLVGSNGRIESYNSGGTHQWGITSQTADADFYLGVTTSSGYVYAGGYSFLFGEEEEGGSGPPPKNALIQKRLTDGSFGASGFAAKINFGSNTQINAITSDSSNNIIITGEYAQPTTGFADMLIASVNENGIVNWARSLGDAAINSFNTFGHKVTLDSDGSIIVVGECRADGQGNRDIIVAKLPPDGSGTGTYGSLKYSTISTSNISTSFQGLSSQSQSSGTSFTLGSRTTLNYVEQAATLIPELFSITP